MTKASGLIGRRNAAISVRGLSVSFASGRGLSALRRENVHEILQDVSFDVAAGEIFGLAGESGSGKSTVAQAITGLTPVSGGSIAIHGTTVTDLGDQDWREIRSHLQLIFQDPFDSLNPRFSVENAVTEPLRCIGVSPSEIPARVETALLAAELDPAIYRSRRPHELSGGERQRVAIARALAVEPNVLVADEPVSMLDVSTSEEIVGLLRRLADERQIAVILISHDFAVLAQVCDRIGILYLGRLVEMGPTQRVIAQPMHHYTRALLDAVPTISGDFEPERGRLPGEPPRPSARPTGCPFHPRCGARTERCVTDLPPLEGDQHVYACWNPVTLP